MTAIDPDEPADTNDAFRPSSPWWGSMVCPVAVVVGRLDTATHGDDCDCERCDERNGVPQFVGKDDTK